MFQFLPALILLLLQSAPADRGALALDWYTLHALRVELCAPVQPSEAGPAVRQKKTGRTHKSSGVFFTSKSGRHQPHVPQPTEGSQESSRSRDGPAFV